MAISTIYVQKFKGTGSPQIYPLLAGTTLGTQIGYDFGTLESGAIHASGGPCVRNRIAEAFGKTFTLQSNDIREKDQGGTGNWGIAYTLVLAGGGVHNGRDSGWHLLHPDGRPCLAFLVASSITDTFAIFSYDGINWNEVTVTLTGASSGATVSDSVSFRDSIFWCTNGNAPYNITEYNFSTNSSTFYGFGLANCRDKGVCVASNELYSISPPAGNSPFYLYKLSGGIFSTWRTQSYAYSSGETTSGTAMFPDGGDIISLTCGQISGGNRGCHATRWQDVATPGTALNITDPVIPSAFRASATGTNYQSWEVLVDNNSNPGLPPTVYIWHLTGYAMMTTYGSRIAYQFQYRAITHGTVTNGPFIAGETVTSAGGATGVIHAVGSGQLHLTDVVGTFASSELLTGNTSGATATSSSLLADQALLSLGSSISPDFSLSCMIRDSVGPYIPTWPNARAELGTLGVQLTHGAVTGPGWALNETITGAGGATATLIIDNTGTIIVYPTNSTDFINGEVITGGSSGTFATLSAGPTDNASIPPVEVVGGTKFYFQVYGSFPATVTLSLYSSATEESIDKIETILSLTLESGTAPGTMPSISGGTIINMPPDSAVRLWSLVHDATTGGFAAGDSYELSLDAV
jgi:hypothetical protein